MDCWQVYQVVPRQLLDMPISKYQYCNFQFLFTILPIAKHFAQHFKICYKIVKLDTDQTYHLPPNLACADGLLASLASCSQAGT